MATQLSKSSPYAGQHAIAWVRQSTKEQSETSCDDQAAVIAVFAERLGIRVVDRATLDGVSGSSARVADEVDRLIERKQIHNDFELLVVHDLSRLTRGGAIAGNYLQYRLAQVGVELLSVHDEHLGGEMGDVLSSFKHMAAQQQAKATALAVTRGRSASIERGDSPSIPRPPFGIDRLVLGPRNQQHAGGEPRFILHLEPDGSQTKLDPLTRQVLGRYGLDGKRGARQHYRKQDDETIVLVAGDPTDAATVREMFRLYDVEGWGYHRICRHLNERSIPAPTGGAWAKSSVRNLVSNPLYVGLAVTQRKVSGRYYARGAGSSRGGGGPIKVERPLAETAGRRHLPHRPRPLSDWRIERLDAFREFLPQPTQRLARRRILRHLREQAAGRRGPRQDRARDRGNVDSPFILTNRITARHSGDVLSGRNTGKVGSSHTYYSVTKARNRPGATGDPLDRKLIPAPPLHELIVAMLGETLRSLPQLGERVKQQARAQLAASTPKVGDETALLEAERKDLSDRLNFLAEHLEHFDLKVAERKMRELSDRYEAVTRQLQRSTSRLSQPKLDVNTAVDRVIAELLQAEGLVRTLGRPMLNRLLDVLLTKAEVDMASRYLELEFRLPHWALEAPERVCRGYSNAHRAGPKAHPFTASETGFLLYRGRFAWTQHGIVGILAA